MIKYRGKKDQWKRKMQMSVSILNFLKTWSKVYMRKLNRQTRLTFHSKNTNRASIRIPARTARRMIHQAIPEYWATVLEGNTVTRTYRVQKRDHDKPGAVSWHGWLQFCSVLLLNTFWMKKYMDGQVTFCWERPFFSITELCLNGFFIWKLERSRLYFVANWTLKLCFFVLFCF